MKKFIDADRFRLPAMFTLEAAYLVPTFLFIVLGATKIAIELYQMVQTTSVELDANLNIDAVKNFRYTCLGQKILN